MTSNLTHIDLFSGIGGFSLASSWAGFKTIVFCEKDKYCHKILNKHWPDVPIIEDIHDFDGKQFSGATLLTGGVPCQPASTAGKRRGTKDDRWLWPETFRIIREAKPKWVILENVRGLLALEQGVVFDNLLSEVETLGYETRPFIIPACGVNAPHKRERVWIVANAIDSPSRAKPREVREANRIPGVDQPTVCSGMSCRTGETETSDAMAYTSQLFSYECNNNTRISPRRESLPEFRNNSRAKNVANTNIQGLQGYWQPGECSRELPFGTARPKTDTRPNWEFEPDVGKLADELPNQLARGIKNGATQKERPRETLQTLRNNDDEKSLQWETRGFWDFFPQGLLRSDLYESRNDTQKALQRNTTEAINKDQATILRALWEFRQFIGSSQKQGLERQQQLELADALFFLSHISSSQTRRHSEEDRQNSLLRLWQTISKAWSVQHSLNSTKKTWESLSEENKDWTIMATFFGTFWSEPSILRVSNKKDRNRANKLKSLGNAIVPQVAYQIIKGIAEIETQLSQHKETQCHN